MTISALCGKQVSRNVCPATNRIESETFDKKVFACFSKDSKLRAESTSGGIFTELSKSIIVQAGKVYGASFNERFDVCHTRADSIAVKSGHFDYVYPFWVII